MLHHADIGTFHQTDPLDPRLEYVRGAMRYANGDFSQVRQLSPLPEDTLNYIDNIIYEIGPDQLNFVGALLGSQELVVDLKDWWGIPAYEYRAVSPHGKAKVSVDPDVIGERHAPDYKSYKVPVPIVWDDMSLGIRALEASRRAKAPADDAFARESIININRELERIAIRGLGYNISGITIPGVAEEASLIDLSGGKPWTDPTKTGEEMVADVRAIGGALIARKRYGPIRIWVSPQSYNATNRDYKALGSDTILDRIKQLQYGGQPVQLDQTQELTDNEVLGVEWKKTSIGVLDGTGPKLITWTDGPGFVVYAMMLACVIPLIRFDYNGETGAVLGTP